MLRRIWCELCKAVGWMHGVGLVHRDIKLESKVFKNIRINSDLRSITLQPRFLLDILLTTPTFNSLTSTSPPPTLSSLPTPPTPFIKLTDFGLSRFVEIDVNGEAELLWTRCGSEAYAAPELVTGGGGGGGGSKEGGGGETDRRGVYDARKTDAWACGVVLYALVGRRLPFGEGVGAQPIGDGGSQIGGGRGIIGRASLVERRHWLMRIARGEYEWPGDLGEGGEAQVEKEQEKDELVGTGLVHSQGARRIVGRLLIRDPKKRARIGDLWDDAWMISCTGTGNGNGNSGGDEGWWKEREKEREWYDSPSSSMVTSQEGVSFETQEQHGLGHEDGREDEDSLDMQGRNQHTIWMFDQAEGGGDALEVYRKLEEGEDGEGENGEELCLLEEEEGEEEEGGCLFDHEGIDSITRQEVV